MANLDKDIEILKSTYEGIGDYNVWSDIYPYTTENVLKVLDMVDVHGMNVYSVLSSSDILFSLIAKKIKCVVTFDINPLTYRYYFLRKWLLECGVLDGKDISFLDAYDIIHAKRKYITKDEEQSVKFWDVYLKMLDKEFFNLYDARLFKYVSKRIACPYDESIDYLLDYLKKTALEFDNIDIGKEVKPNKKYDLVYASNIMDLQDFHRVEEMRDNINMILKPEGQVICSNLVNHPYFDFFKSQRQIFEEKYLYDELFKDRVGSTINTYYRYIKK